MILKIFADIITVITLIIFRLFLSYHVHCIECACSVFVILISTVYILIILKLHLDCLRQNKFSDATVSL